MSLVWCNKPVHWPTNRPFYFAGNWYNSKPQADIHSKNFGKHWVTSVDVGSNQMISVLATDASGYNFHESADRSDIQLAVWHSLKNEMSFVWATNDLYCWYYKLEPRNLNKSILHWNTEVCYLWKSVCWEVAVFDAGLQPSSLAHRPVLVNLHVLFQWVPQSGMEVLGKRASFWPKTCVGIEAEKLW